jgi:beta-lactam-binding protein with PASTA domain/predicted Ser/Thr protein kinase
MTVLAGRYELVEKVGEGGMSVVWRARDTRLERDVAVKLLRPFVAPEEDRRRRFAREARTLAALSNDHIVRVHDYIEAGADAFLVMEFIDGRSLAAATFHRLPLAWSEAASYAAAVCEALDYAHAKGVTHRDLTPSNILIENNSGRVVTSDFGLARLARAGGSATTIGVLLGTPEYWSPEQARGRDTDGATDMYALGCILYLLLSGRLPFDGEDRLAVGLRRAHEDPPSLGAWSPAAPESAIRLVDSLLCRDPSRRPDARATALAIADASRDRAARKRRTLGPREADAPTVAVSAPTVRIATKPKPKPKPRRRRRSRWLVPVLGAIAGVCAGVFAAAHVFDRGVHVPNVIRMRETIARAQILHTMPTANVSVVRVYSTRVRRGRVVRQRPRPDAMLKRGVDVTLLVSKGTPFAQVPSILPGTAPETAKAYVERSGFTARYRWTPSWYVHKGTVVELSPAGGARVRRPATVRIVVSSGWPRQVVPDLSGLDLESAKQALEAKHLRYGVVYHRSQTAVPDHVLAQKPAAGNTVYEGTRIWLGAARRAHWTKVFSTSGSDAYDTVPFTVRGRWRIQYRLDAGDDSDPFAEISWTRDGDLFSDGSFVADTSGALRTHDVSDGAGTYHLTVRPYASDASWYVEVESLQ